MSRKPITEGEKRNEKISISVTPSILANIKTLADITHKGNINGLVVDLIEDSIEKNLHLIKRVQQGKCSYQSILEAATAEYNNSIAQ